MQIIDKFKDQIPASADFNVGYFDDNQVSKVLLVTEDDMDIMYWHFPNGGIVTLWCDARSNAAKKRKRDEGGNGTGTFLMAALRLVTEHKEKYTTHLWARMHHQLYDNNIINEDGFKEQKENILLSLRKLYSIHCILYAFLLINSWVFYPAIAVFLGNRRKAC